MIAIYSWVIVLVWQGLLPGTAIWNCIASRTVLLKKIPSSFYR
jgi:hypothetical protein